MSEIVSVCIHRTKGILVSQGDAGVLSLHPFLGGNMDRKWLVRSGGSLLEEDGDFGSTEIYVQYEVIYILALVAGVTLSLTHDTLDQCRIKSWFQMYESIL